MKEEILKKMQHEIDNIVNINIAMSRCFCGDNDSQYVSYNMGIQTSDLVRSNDNLKELLLQIDGELQDSEPVNENMGEENTIQDDVLCPPWGNSHIPLEKRPTANY